MKELWPFIKLMLSEWKWLALGSGLGLITLLSGIGLLSLSGWFIAASAFAGLGTASAMAFNYLLPSGGVRFFSLARILARYGERITTHEATFRILSRLRIWFYNKLEPLAPAHLLNYRSSDLLNRLVSDIDAMDNLYVRVITPIILALLVIVSILCYFSFFSVKLALFISACLLITGVSTPLLSNLLSSKAGQSLQETINKLRTQIIDFNQGLMELTIFAANDKQMKLMGKTQEKLLLLQNKIAQIKGLIIFLISLMLGGTIWVTVYLWIQDVHAGKLNGAILALLILGIMAAFEAILPIPLAFQYLGKTTHAAKRLLEIANSKPSVMFVPETKAQINDTAIHFDQISFAYSGHDCILKNFKLQISSGEKVGLVGPTGAGKSTLVHLLTRCWDPSQGEIKIGGANIKDLSEADLRQLITVISQKPYMFNTTIRANLMLAKPTADETEIWYALEKAQLANFVRELPEGLETWIGEYGVFLSGGQLRRLAIARAILHDSPIWILDEPTEGLDNITRREVLLQLKELMQEKTVMMISHRRSDLINMDRVINLKQSSS